MIDFNLSNDDYFYVDLTDGCSAVDCSVLFNFSCCEEREIFHLIVLAFLLYLCIFE